MILISPKFQQFDTKWSESSNDCSKIKRQNRNNQLCIKPLHNSEIIKFDDQNGRELKDFAHIQGSRTNMPTTEENLTRREVSIHKDLSESIQSQGYDNTEADHNSEEKGISYIFNNSNIINTDCSRRRNIMETISKTIDIQKQSCSKQKVILEAEIYHD